MGTVIQLKRKVNDCYNELRSSVDQKISLVEDKIKSRLESDVNLIQEMVVHHLNSGGKRIRALLTLECSKLCGYSLGLRDVNLATCVELIHSATLMHDESMFCANHRLAQSAGKFPGDCSRDEPQAKPLARNTSERFKTSRLRPIKHNRRNN